MTNNNDGEYMDNDRKFDDLKEKELERFVDSVGKEKPIYLCIVGVSC